MENQKQETFYYTYSADRQEELKAIRKKYAGPEETEDKLEQIRRLDEGVTRKAEAASLAVGILGALILGFGMSLVMTDLPAAMGIHHTLATVLGIPVGVVGLIAVCLAYPLYNRVIRQEREKVAPEILRLTDELME